MAIPEKGHTPNIVVLGFETSSDRLSPGTADMVRHTAGLMLSRLAYGAAKRGRGHRDVRPEPFEGMSVEVCRDALMNSLNKGNLIDAMNYLMFAHTMGHDLRAHPEIDTFLPSESSARAELARATGYAGRSWTDLISLVARDKSAYAVNMKRISEALGSTEVTLHANEMATRIRLMRERLSKPGAVAFRELAEAVEKLEKRFPTPEKLTIAHHVDPGTLTPEQVEQITKVTRSSIDQARPLVINQAMSAPYGTDPESRAYAEMAVAALAKHKPDLSVNGPSYTFDCEKDHADYAPLMDVLYDALTQAAYGKGRERHANDLPFTEQPILAMARLLGSEDGLAQQVIKKVTEARGLPPERREAELLGAIVYAAAMVLYYREQE